MAGLESDNRRRRICVFCGSQVGALATYTDCAEELGTELAARRIDLVYGGGRVGLMGVLADAALAAGGKVIGVIPQALWDREVGHSGLTKLHVVDSMHARKALMSDLCDAFAVLPGGHGTFDELFEMVTWSQLGIHHKPIALLNVEGYFNPLLELVAVAQRRGFVRPPDAEIIQVADTVTALVKLLG